ncbi:hypothetical protein T552_01729 [Pneumocystis carinii B80]|uniref:Uncharacterized protein n=1 Tax=Pneumocystis carinii (strain B80) TaxID=1408658 RepID=A0A0W4ZJD2_PNEC8|nr:hypothetical protein T552_01729 [Pneumocystis carinii B80]KTW28468.1 hypothetical protein T552_01729 [Pneumocystis carinii B80]
MFESQKPFSIGNKESSGNTVFSFGSSAQTNVSSSQPTFSFNTAQQQDKPQGFSSLEMNTVPSVNNTSVSNPLVQPSGGFSFGNPFQKTDKCNIVLDPLQTSNTQNTTHSQSEPTLQSGQVISGATHYTEIPKDGRDFLEEMDKYIITQTQISDYLQSQASSIDELVKSVPKDVKEVTKRSDQIATDLISDVNQLMTLRMTVDNDYNNAKLSKNVISSVPMPYIDCSRVKDPILAYFENTSNDIEKKINNYAKNIEDLEKHLEYLEKDHSENKTSPEALLNTLKAEYDFFLALSNNAAEVHDKIKQLQIHNLGTNFVSQ